jgi:putative transposase
MARLPRYAAAGLPQHVIQRGVNRAPLFGQREDYTYFRDCVAAAIKRLGCRLHAYVLMTNHVHFLMTPARNGAIGAVMQSVGRRYVPYFNRAYGRTGTLWAGRYRATPVDSERYLLNCYRYIELNPVRACIVADPRDYAWSSHRRNAFGDRDALVSPHPAYDALGPDETDRRVVFRGLFVSPLDDSTLEEIRAATNSGGPSETTRFAGGSRLSAVAGRSRWRPAGDRLSGNRCSDPNSFGA